MPNFFTFTEALYDLIKSENMQAVIKKIKGDWEPLIKILEEVADEVERIYKANQDERKEEEEPSSQLSEFQKKLSEFLEKIKALIEKIKSLQGYKLIKFNTPSEAEEYAKSEKGKHAICYYQDELKQLIYIGNKSRQCIKGPAKTGKGEDYTLFRDGKKEARLTVMGKTVVQPKFLKIDKKKIDAILDDFDIKHGTDWEAYQEIIKKISPMLHEFDNLHLQNKLIKKFEALNWKEILKKFEENKLNLLSLPFMEQADKNLIMDIYKNAKDKMKEWLDENHFNSLSADEKAMTLALMELYNEGLKKIYVAVRAFEKKMNRKEGFLLAKPLFDDKSLIQLGEELSKAYKASMATAGYTTLVDTALKNQSPQQAVEKNADSSFEQVQTAEDFRFATLAALRQRYAEFLKLKKKLKSQQPESADPFPKANIKETIQAAQKAILEVDKVLQTAIDKTVYRAYFLPKSTLQKMKEQEQGWIKIDNKWIEKEKVEKEPENVDPWLRDAGYAFMQVKKIISRIKALQAEIAEKKEEEEEKDENKKTNTPFSHLAKRAKLVDELAAAGLELTGALNKIKNNPYLQKLRATALEEVDDKVKESFTQINTAIKKFHTDFKQNVDAIDLLFNNLPLDKNEELKNIFRGVTALSTKLKNFLAVKEEIDEKSVFNVLAFTINNFSEIETVLRDLAAILDLLPHIPREKLPKLAEKINGVIEQVLLFGDRLEIELSLKKGYLTDKLDPSIRQFHEKLFQAGYVFKKEKQYPYSLAIRKQREDLLAREDISRFHKELIKRREWPENKSKKRNQQEIHEEIIKAVEAHMQSLHEKSSHSTKLKKKIELLGTLLNFKNTDLSTRLEQFKLEYPNEVSLLMKSDTGDLLRQLEYNEKNISQQDIFQSLQIHLAGLKKQRNSYFLNANLLEKRISACETLHALLKENNLEHALLDLQHFDPEKYKLLKNHDSVLLNKIKLMNAALGEEERLMTVIGKAKLSPPLPLEVKKDVSELKDLNEDLFKLNQQIEDKIAQLQNKFVKWNNDLLRLKLLEELKKEVKNNSVEDAIQIIKGKDKHAYLLFQGTVGRMMEEISHSRMSPEDLTRRIEHTIEVLSGKKYEKYFLVFNRSQSEREKIDEHIKALRSLQQALVKQRPEELIQSLTEGQRKVLQRYEPVLLNDLMKFHGLDKGRPERLAP